MIIIMIIMIIIMIIMPKHKKKRYMYICCGVTVTVTVILCYTLNREIEFLHAGDSYTTPNFVIHLKCQTDRRFAV